MAKKDFYGFSTSMVDCFGPSTDATCTMAATTTSTLPSTTTAATRTTSGLLLLLGTLLLFADIGTTLAVVGESGTGNVQNDVAGSHNYTTTPTSAAAFGLRPAAALAFEGQRLRRDLTAAAAARGAEAEVDTQETALVSSGRINNSNNNNINDDNNKNHQNDKHRNNDEYVNGFGINANNFLAGNRRSELGGLEARQGQRQRQGDSLKELNIIKRAPNGFMGMRGKKEYDDYHNNNNNDMDWNLDPIEHTIYNNELDRMANNEDGDDVDEPGEGSKADYASSRFKKAPSAFYGVRGKKYPNFGGSASGIPSALTNNYNFNEILEEIEEERLREAMLRDFIGGLSTKQAEQNEVIIKRAPTGFTGLRGKRPAYNYYNWNRLQLNGLHDGLGESSIEVPEVDKRAPTNAFVGVRGKKDVSHQHYKRSPNDKSFATKRQRFIDFNNKFVAVRGKKDNIIIDDVSHEEEYHDEDLAAFNDDIHLNLPTAGKRNNNALNNDNNNNNMYDADYDYGNVDDDVGDGDAGVSEKQNIFRQRYLGFQPWQTDADWLHRKLRSFIALQPSSLFGLKRAPNGFVGIRGKREVKDSSKLTE